jgi:hypothetical protein
MAKKQINSILEIDMKEYLEPCEDINSGQDLTKAFNKEHGTEMHYNDFQSLVGRAFGHTYFTDDQGYNAYKLQLKTAKKSRAKKSELEEEETDTDNENL